MGEKLFEALYYASIFFVLNQNILKRGKKSCYVENDFMNASLHSDTFFLNVGYILRNAEYSTLTHNVKKHIVDKYMIMNIFLQ